MTSLFTIPALSKTEESCLIVTSKLFTIYRILCLEQVSAPISSSAASFLAILTILLTRVQPSFIDQRLHPGGSCNPPLGFWTSRPNFFFEIIPGYVFGVKESNGDSYNCLSLSRDLKTCSWLRSTSMTFTFKVMEWLHSIYS